MYMYVHKRTFGKKEPILHTETQQLFIDKKVGTGGALDVGRERKQNEVGGARGDQLSVAAAAGTTALASTDDWLVAAAAVDAAPPSCDCPRLAGDWLAGGGGGAPLALAPLPPGLLLVLAPPLCAGGVKLAMQLRATTVTMLQREDRQKNA